MGRGGKLYSRAWASSAQCRRPLPWAGVPPGVVWAVPELPPAGATGGLAALPALLRARPLAGSEREAGGRSPGAAGEPQKGVAGEGERRIARGQRAC